MKEDQCSYLPQEKPLQYYKLLCRLASDSREPDRLTLQVKTIIQGASALEFWTKRFAKAFRSLILMVVILTWHSLIPNGYRSISLSRNKKINWKPSSGRSQENDML